MVEIRRHAVCAPDAEAEGGRLPAPDEGSSRMPARPSRLPPAGGGDDVEAAAQVMQQLIAELRAAMTEAAEHRDRADRLTGVVRSVLAALPYGVVVLDDQGRVALWSVRAERLLEVPATAAVGRALEAVEGLGPEMPDAVARCLGDGGGETRLRRGGVTLHLLCRPLASGRSPGAAGHASAVVLVEDPSAG